MKKGFQRSTRLGTAAELFVVADLLRFTNYTVIPMLEGSPYDLLVENGKFHRVQVKQTSKVDGNILTFSMGTVAASAKGWRNKTIEDYRGIADVFALVAILPRGMNVVYKPCNDIDLRATDQSIRIAKQQFSGFDARDMSRKRVFERMQEDRQSS